MANTSAADRDGDSEDDLDRFRSDWLDLAADRGNWKSGGEDFGQQWDIDNGERRTELEFHVVFIIFTGSKLVPATHKTLPPQVDLKDVRR